MDVTGDEESRSCVKDCSDNLSRQREGDTWSAVFVDTGLLTDVIVRHQLAIFLVWRRTPCASVAENAMGEYPG